MNRLLSISLAILCCIFPGCTTLTAWQANPRVQFAETEAIKLGLAFFSNGGSADTAWGISNGINIIGDIANFSQQQRQAADAAAANALAAAQLKAQVKAFADNPKAVNGLADGLAKVVQTSGAATPSERAAVTLAIANGIQQATTAATK